MRLCRFLTSCTASSQRPTQLLSPSSSRGLFLRFFSSEAPSSSSSAAPRPSTSLATQSELFIRSGRRNVVVGMSGGVDSSIAAYLLQQQGYEVIGLNMRNWDELDETGVCTGDADHHDAQRVCQKLGIRFESVNFVKEYWVHVFEAALHGYAAGITPNPDLLCNREIKFKTFLEYAMNRFSAEFVATGHFARILHANPGQSRLLAAADPSHDQSYFLATLKSGSLARVLFPVGDLTKSQVRAKARELHFCVADKKSSRGICFVGKRNFPQFLSNYIQPVSGDIATLTGEVIGSHEGIASMTIGQKARLPGMTQKWFVVDKDVERNQIIVAEGVSHPALFSNSWTLHNFSWVCETPPFVVPATSQGCEFPILFRTRYQHPLSEGLLVIERVPQISSAHQCFRYRVKAMNGQKVRAVTPGQVVVLYDLNGVECYGGGEVLRVESTMHDGNPLKLGLPVS